MYTIKAHPTLYNGRQYRSRLEARWAAFFDVLGWRHEYEPLDMDGWSPDFLLGDDVFVEVKPITEAEPDIIKRLSQYHRPKLEILLVSIKPFYTPGSPISRSAIGWMTDMCYYEPWFEPANVVHAEPEGGYDFCHAYGAYGGRMQGARCHKCYGVEMRDMERLWAQASNMVQWQKA